MLVVRVLYLRSSWCLGRAAVCDCGTPWTFSDLFLRGQCDIYFMVESLLFIFVETA